MDRVQDQEVWARALTHGSYPEGNVSEGQVFRVGHSLHGGDKILSIPFPAVRMEYLRSNNLAVRVNPPVENDAATSFGQDVEAEIREARSARARRKEDKSDGDGLPTPDGGGKPV